MQFGRVLAGTKHVRSLSSAPTVGRRPQRERQGPQRSSAVEPTQRGSRAPTSGSPSSVQVLSEELIEQVAKSLQPPVGKKCVVS